MFLSRETFGIVVLLILGTAGNARGECDPVEAERKIAFLHETLTHEAHKVHVWSWTWGSIYAGAGVAQIVAMPFSDSQARKTLAVGVGSAAFGSLSLFLLPLRVTRPITALAKRWDDPDRCGVLADAERALQRSAHGERQATGWVGHVGNAIVNIALTMIIGLGFDNWTSGMITGAIGFLVGELNLVTQPAGLPATQDAYSRGGWMSF